jgi:hypothetical protein
LAVDEVGKVCSLAIVSDLHELAVDMWVVGTCLREKMGKISSNLG